MTFVFSPQVPHGQPIDGSGGLFPIHRIYCVGRNYADHIVEMGGEPEREPPFFFSKPSDAACINEHIAYPPRTNNLHHEVELVIALGHGGANIAPSKALDHVFAYGVGVDLTRRDLQAEAKKRGRPWDMAKGFDESAPMAPLKKVEDIGHPDAGRIWLEVNGKLKQEGDLSQQIWSVAEIIANLSTYVRLSAGDLIMTGTPAGVGPLISGDQVNAGIDGVNNFSFMVGEACE